MLKINEIFYSIQGEGGRTGHPSIFIRLSGCNLKCNFCDTNHEPFSLMTEPEIIKLISGYPCKWIVLTGGEPLIQDVSLLVSLLKNNGYSIAIETNGTQSLNDLNLDWITVSPKSSKIQPDFFKRIPNEIKYIVNEKSEIKLIDLDCPVYLQPESSNPNAIRRCVDLVKENSKWRLSLQTQKLIKIQ